MDPNRKPKRSPSPRVARLAREISELTASEVHDLRKVVGSRLRGDDDSLGVGVVAGPKDPLPSLGAHAEILREHSL